MSLVYFAAGFAAGAVVSVGGTLFYLRRKMKTQLGALESQMEEMDAMFDDLED